jgi:hypothetical protein
MFTETLTANDEVVGISCEGKLTKDDLERKQARRLCGGRHCHRRHHHRLDAAHFFQVKRRWAISNPF